MFCGKFLQFQSVNFHGRPIVKAARSILHCLTQLIGALRIECPGVAGVVMSEPAVANGYRAVGKNCAAGMVVIAPAAAPLRVGLGRIESLLAVPSAAAGGTAPSSTKRIVMRMDDGSVQYFDTQAAGLAVGDRIEITKDGTMRHPA